MKSQEIRQTFLEYFRGKDHEILPSSPVIPRNDPTLLFANAGMNQFKDVFTGVEKRPAPRAATVQKCIRAGGKHNDLDNVGYTARHLTFFEMLGNFSFGDYFKEGAIESAWDLLLRGFGLPAERLWVTVYHEDEEARAIWRDRAGVPEGRIRGLGEKDNYWSMGDVGPCGPCSEILLDRGEEYGCGPDCGIGSCECDRYFEIWNLVFMQFNQEEDGSKVPLARPCIDTGMGLERLAMVLQRVDSVYETDVLRSIIGRVEEATGVPYARGPGSTPHRVIADHIRSLVFAFADGAEPSNEGRGYVLRRILRRAARYGRKLHSGERPLLCRLVEPVLAAMGDAYPEIREREAYITAVIESEEERFGRTLDSGLRQFEELVERLRAAGERTIPGTEAFLLYDTFGFPVDLVQQMAAEISLDVDLASYEAEMASQRDRSRQSAKFRPGADDSGEEPFDFDALPPTEFVGYSESGCDAEVVATAGDAGGTLQLVLNRTPFYAESGGQVGDTGLLRGRDITLRVEDTQKHKDRWIHFVRVMDGDPGALRAGTSLAALVDEDRRSAIARNHTVTHLLHSALRTILGDHVHQKGSLVDPTRTRFDVTHFHAIGVEEREEIEELVEREIAANTPLEIFETDYDDAVRRGAIALFGEKYGARVRVVRVGDFSMELCGGIHVARTGDIGSFALTGEGSVSAGVRRVEAATESVAVRRRLAQARIVEELAARLKVPAEQLVDRVAKLQEEIKKLRSAGAQKAARPASGASDVRKETVGATQSPVELHSAFLGDGGRQAALDLYDRLKARAPRAIFLLLAPDDGKVAVIVAVSPELAHEGWDAREVFRAGQKILGARGGGRPEMVQGAGTKPESAAAALEAMAEFARRHAGGGSEKRAGAKA